MRSRWIIALTTGLLLSAAVPLTAQVQPPTSVRVVGGFVNGRSLVVSTDKPARIVVFAVGRGALHNPIEVISALAPDKVRGSRPEKKLRLGELTETQLARFASTSELVIVALAAVGEPRLDHFIVDGKWAHDIVVSDTMMRDGQGLIASLAEAVFGKDVRYAARLVTVDPTTLTVGHLGAVANAFHSVNLPLTLLEILTFVREKDRTITRDDVRRAITVLRDTGEIVASRRAPRDRTSLSLEVEEEQYETRRFSSWAPLRVWSVGDGPYIPIR